MPHLSKIAQELLDLMDQQMSMLQSKSQSLLTEQERQAYEMRKEKIEHLTRRLDELGRRN